MNCIVYGEVLWDVYPDKSVIGGAPFNFAAHLSLLREKVYLITGVGRDKLGNETLAYIKSLPRGVGCSTSRGSAYFRALPAERRFVMLCVHAIP